MWKILKEKKCTEGIYYQAVNGAHFEHLMSINFSNHHIFICFDKLLLTKILTVSKKKEFFQMAK